MLNTQPYRPLGLKTQKETTNETMKKLPLRKGSARVAKMKVYPKGLFLTILEIQSQSNTILTRLHKKIAICILKTQMASKIT